MNIKAIYDQTITKAIRNDDGDVIAHEPTTHHYTFGSVGSELSGGFYLKAGDELPKMIHLKAEPQDVIAKVPALDITVSIVETDDPKHAEKRIEKWKKDHKCKGKKP